jgi:hypothetical protein
LGTVLGGEEQETDDLHPMGRHRAVLLVALLIAVVALALLPVVIALGVAPATADGLVAGFGGLAAAIGGAKLLTGIWAATSRPSSSQRALSASPSSD